MRKQRQREVTSRDLKPGVSQSNVMSQSTGPGREDPPSSPVLPSEEGLGKATQFQWASISSSSIHLSFFIFFNVQNYGRLKKENVECLAALTQNKYKKCSYRSRLHTNFSKKTKVITKQRPCHPQSRNQLGSAQEEEEKFPMWMALKTKRFHLTFTFSTILWKCTPKTHVFTKLRL